MQFDKETIKDLEIFRSSEDGASIFDILDRTITTGGKYRLHDRFIQPLSDINQIQEIQDTVFFLSKHLEDWKYPFSNNMMKSLENYVSSNIEPVKVTTRFQVLLQGIHYYIIDRYTYHYLKESITEMVEYTSRFLKTFENFDTGNLPVLLRFILNEFKSFTGEPVFRILSEKTSRQRKLTFTEVYYFDGLLRSTHKDQLKKSSILLMKWTRYFRWQKQQQNLACVSLNST